MIYVTGDTHKSYVRMVYVVTNGDKRTLEV